MIDDKFLEEMGGLVRGVYYAGKAGASMQWLVDAQAEWEELNRDNPKAERTGARCFELLMTVYHAGKEGEPLASVARKQKGHR